MNSDDFVPDVIPDEKKPLEPPIETEDFDEEEDQYKLIPVNRLEE